MRTTIQALRERFLYGAMALALTAGCTGQATNDDDGPTVGVNGKLLHAEKLGPGHRLEFYNFGEGENAVHESYSADSGEKGVLDTMPEKVSLADVYQRLKPGAVVPAQLLEADVRATTFAKAEAQRAVASPAPDTNMSIPDGVASPGADLLQASTGTCSGDFYGDNWGAQWFLNNYCNEGRFRWCQTNWLSASETGNYSPTRWKQMEGDFNVPGHTHGDHSTYDCCFICACGLTRHVDWDYDVLPRKVEIWTYTGSSPARRIFGSSPCNHLHVADLGL